MYQFVSNNGADRVSVKNIKGESNYEITVDFFNDSIHAYYEVGRIFLYMIDVLSELDDMYPTRINAPRIAATMLGIYKENKIKESLQTATAMGCCIIGSCRDEIRDKAEALVRMQIRTIARMHAKHVLDESTYAEFYYCETNNDLDRRIELVTIQFGKAHTFSFKPIGEWFCHRFIEPLFKINIPVKSYSDIFNYIETATNIVQHEKYDTEKFGEAFIDSGIATSLFPEICEAIRQS